MIVTDFASASFGVGWAAATRRAQVRSTSSRSSRLISARAAVPPAHAAKMSQTPSKTRRPRMRRSSERDRSQPRTQWPAAPCLLLHPEAGDRPALAIAPEVEVHHDGSPMLVVLTLDVVEIHDVAEGADSHVARAFIGHGQPVGASQPVQILALARGRFAFHGRLR